MVACMPPMQASPQSSARGHSGSAASEGRVGGWVGGWDAGALDDFVGLGVLGER